MGGNPASPELGRHRITWAAGAATQSMMGDHDELAATGGLRPERPAGREPRCRAAARSRSLTYFLTTASALSGQDVPRRCRGGPVLSPLPHPCGHSIIRSPARLAGAVSCRTRKNPFRSPTSIRSTVASARSSSPELRRNTTRRPSPFARPATRVRRRRGSRRTPRRAAGKSCGLTATPRSTSGDAHSAAPSPGSDHACRCGAGPISPARTARFQRSQSGPLRLRFPHVGAHDLRVDAGASAEEISDATRSTLLLRGLTGQGSRSTSTHGGPREPDRRPKVTVAGQHL